MNREEACVKILILTSMWILETWREGGRCELRETNFKPSRLKIAISQFLRARFKLLLSVNQNEETGEQEGSKSVKGYIP